MEYHYKQNFLIGYGEVDEHNRLRISSLLNFLQNIATLHSKELGYGTTACLEKKIGWVLLSWHIRFFYYPQGDTNLVVKTWSRKLKGYHAFRTYQVEDESGKIVAEADSMWTLISLETGRPIRISEEMSNLYGEIDKNFFEEERVKIEIPAEHDNVIDLKILRRDIDTNKHCNNTKYIEFALESIPQEVYDNKKVKELEILYKKSVVYGNKIEVSCTNVAENEFVNVIKKENGEIATIIKTKWE